MHDDPLKPDEIAPYFGALARMATADGRLASEEIADFKTQLAAHGVPEDQREALANLLADPPGLDEVLEPLRSSPSRFTLYLDAVQMALADGVVDASEEHVIQTLQLELGISDVESQALRDFAMAASKASPVGPASDVGRERLTQAAANLAAVGIPLGAVAASGSVSGLSAAGITSGLAALGLGFGVASGVGACMALGFVSYKGVKWMLTPSDG